MTYEDSYPPEKLEQMRENPSREDTTWFIRVYHERIEMNLHVPQHWHKFAADILFRAQEALNKDYSSHKGSLAKVMGLQGSVNLVTRDMNIAVSIQQIIHKETEEGRKYGSLKKAANLVYDRLEANGLPTKGMDDAWKHRRKKDVERLATQFPEDDFLAMLQ